MYNKELTTLQLNRTLLLRQFLLERWSSFPPEQFVDRLAGLNAQYSQSAFISLWSRLECFPEDRFRRALLDGVLVRASLMRGTLHIVTSKSYLTWRVALLPVLRRVVNSFFPGVLGRLSIDRLSDEVETLLSSGPMTRAQIGRALVKAFPYEKPEALGFTARLLLPVVQVASDTRWAYPVTPTYTWLGEPSGEADPDKALSSLVEHYLESYGPASVADFQSWSGLSGAQKILEAIKSLDPVCYRLNHKPWLYDSKDAKILEHDVEAPVRFLPDYDNVLFAYSDRSRIISRGLQRLIIRGTPRMPGVVLVDGFVGGMWTLTANTKKPTLTVNLVAGKPEDVKHEAEMLAYYLDCPTLDVKVGLNSGA